MSKNAQEIAARSELEWLKLVVENNVALVRFVRPSERNPLSITVLIEIDEILNSLGNETKALIFTGSEDVFASGANLREIARLKNESEVRVFGLRGQNLMRKIADSSLLTIAAVNGYCFGGAFDLALACKIRLASANAVFSHPGANLGIITGWGGTQRLPRIVGEAAALEMFLTAKRIGAEEALKINLISQICEDVVETARSIAFSLSPHNEINGDS